jgi:formylglycine-generating enzyme required for sulfatase activity
VYLDTYQIGKYEVTNRQYAQCVKAAICGGKSSFVEEWALHPMVNITWDDAVTYCEWVGGRLPTEAEWEKAASWDAEAKMKFVYPWGNEAPTDAILNYNNNVGYTTRVGTYLDGVSPYGLFDMAGNVWEWVNDWYNETYYQNSPSSNPLGPVSGVQRVVRGGAWRAKDNFVRSAHRGPYNPAKYTIYVGFRCSRSP